MIFEMHCHTCEFSRCSVVSAVRLVRQCLEKGLQGIVLTDHHHWWPSEALEELRRASGAPEHFVILSGQEMGTPEFGDVLVFGAKRVYSKGTSIDAMRADYPDAAVVLAHPWRKGRLPTAGTLLDARLDAVEIFNSNHTAAENLRGLQAWHEHRFIATAGSDTHAENYAALYPTLFDHPIGSVEEFAQEIRAGRCRPYFKEVPHARKPEAEIVEVSLGTGAAEHEDQRLVQKTHESASAWEEGERAFHIQHALHEACFSGGKYRVPMAVGEDLHQRRTIEERVAGELLIDFLRREDAERAREALDLTAGWLARLHNARLQLTSVQEFYEYEKGRLEAYSENLRAVEYAHASRFAGVAEALLEAERILYQDNSAAMVQCHGDMHPKNVLIGHEETQGTYVAVIDFGSSRVMPPAFDVASFVEHLHYQASLHVELEEKVSVERFLQRYFSEADSRPRDFAEQVTLFRARLAMRILHYLVKVGLGDTPDCWRLLVEAERNLTHLHSLGFPAGKAGAMRV